MSLIGKAICAWKGKHAWRRVKRTTPVMHDGIQVGAAHCHVSQCSRCGATRPIKPRVRKANVAIAEGGGNG